MITNLMAVNVSLQKSNQTAPGKRHGLLLDYRRLACENRVRLCRGA